MELKFSNKKKFKNSNSTEKKRRKNISTSANYESDEILQNFLQIRGIY